MTQYFYRLALNAALTAACLSACRFSLFLAKPDLRRQLLAKRIVEAGGSLRDVQELAGHASLATTQRYIQGDSREAERHQTDLIPPMQVGVR